MRLRAGAIILVCAGLLAYGNSLSSPFILDDEESIVRNPHVVSLWPVTEAMSAPAQSSFAGRPLASFSLAVSHAAGGMSPAAFRIWNIAFLIASALVLAALASRTLRVAGYADADNLAIAIALVWLLHPLNSEVVNYITQRTESLMGLCYLLTLYAAARAMDETRSSARWAAAAVFACGAGMAAKESMATAPVMVLAYDAVFGAGSIAKALTRRTAMYGGLASTWLLLIYLNISGPRSGSAGFGTAVSPLTYLLNQGEMIATYLKLSLWPSPLIVDYGRTTAIETSAALPALVFITAIALAVAMAWRRHRVLAFLGTWFFVTLAPTSSIVPIATEVGAERRMYLPLVAIVALVLFSIRRATNNPRVTMAIAMAASIAAGAVTFARNRDYHDPIAIWQQVVAERPHGRAHYNLAIALNAAGRSAEASRHFAAAAAANEPHAHYALGFEAAAAGRHGDAAAALRTFLQLRPADPVAAQAWLLLGESLVHLKQPADAERAFRSALEMAPQYGDAQGKLADLLLQQGRLNEAAAAYRAYLADTPNNAAARHGLGLALAMTGQTADALNEFAQAVSLEPRSAEFRLSLGTALASSGRVDRAIAEYRQALDLAPANARIMSALGLALADAGARAESMELFRRALALAPSDETIRQEYAMAMGLRR